MRALAAVLYREGRIRATNAAFIFWDLVYPLTYLLVFGVGITHTLEFAPSLLASDGARGSPADYNAFFLAGVLGMASFGIASNTAWSFFLDRDNGIFYEMLTYPLTRAQYLIGKVLFNVGVAVAQAAVTVVLAGWVLGISINAPGLPLLIVAVGVGTAGWFFFYAIFALRIRRNDIFNTVTSVFYFVFLFVSSMFYPLEPLPAVFRAIGYANPITWHVDVLRYATIGFGDGGVVVAEAVAFVAFAGLAFAIAVRELERQE